MVLELIKNEIKKWYKWHMGVEGGRGWSIHSEVYL